MLVIFPLQGYTLFILQLKFLVIKSDSSDKAAKYTQSSGALAFVSYIQKQKRNNHKDFQHCLFACFLSQIEPNKISEALEDENLPYGKKAIGTKWVYKNKKDKRGVVVRNKARLVSQGHRQEEGIDYDEILSSLRRWILKMNIDNTLFIKKDKNDIMLVQVYVDDIIFGSTKRSWCDEFEALMKSRFQMSSMGELTFFLGLQVKQKEMYSIETQNVFKQDEEMLMWMFQVTLKTSHLNVMKRIFMYLKGKPKLGLWYPRVSSFDLEAYSDSDYAGANLDRKSTTGGCQFLGRRLISWQCKKQTIMATSTTEAKYVAATNCCGQNQVFHSKTKHIEIRHHFIRDAYEKKLIQVLKVHTDDNVVDLLTKAFDVSRIWVVTKHSQLKAKTFAEIQGLYERQKRVIDDFKPMDSDDAVKDSKEAAGVHKQKVLEEPNSTKVEVKQEGHEESIRKRPGRRLKMKA
ncbi:putative ribonuclease H-like domain-containing protein [Tanacetum coccineum]